MGASTSVNDPTCARRRVSKILLITGLLLASTLAAVATWRYIQLGRELAAVRQTLAQHLRAQSATAENPSERVARVVEADERLFDHAVGLASARHAVGWVVFSTWVLAATLSILLLRSLAALKHRLPQGGD